MISFLIRLLHMTGGKMCVRHLDNGDVLDDRGDSNGCDSSAARRHHALARDHAHEGHLWKLPQGIAYITIQS